MELPSHVQAALGIASSITEDDLAVHETAGRFAQLTFGLSGAEFASAAANATSVNASYLIQAAARVPRSWQYLEILYDGAVECAGVCTPEIGAGLPPTAASQVLVGAWFFDSTLLDGNNVVPQKVVHNLKTASTAAAFPVRILKEWSQVCPTFEGSIIPPVWVSKSQIQITSGSRVQIGHAPASRFQDLFIETVSEVKSKWRYLSIYRIFEHGYLSEVFEILKSSFFGSPKESLQAASSSLESELNQFISLVHNTGLNNHFALLHDEFETSRKSGNRFAVAIEQSFRQTGQIKLVKEKWQKGVLICYKIRCAIVHAGVSSPIFDAYPDGSVCLDVVLPVCESAVLQFLGISAL